ncbi:MAG: T9SS type A sorting domain-containing protein [Ignavibacteria bacterium]|nr:T9SS type A sorting domain-containing protein [Ignavibacteria bacterium]
MKKLIYALPIIAIVIITLSFLPEKSNTEIKDVNFVNFENKTALDLNSVTSPSGKVSGLFTVVERDAPGISNIARKHTSIELNKSQLRNLYNTKSETLNLEIPLENNRNIELSLMKVNILDPQFRLTSQSQSGKQTVPYTPGVYYRGVVKGNSNSLVSISVFENEFYGLVSDESGNYNIGKVQRDNINSNEYVVINDFDLTILSGFKCGVDGKENKLDLIKYKDLKNNQNHSNHSHGETDNNTAAVAPVRSYFECDYRMYLDFASNLSTVANYVTAMYNSVATIYNNESIPVTISEILTWTGNDPYSGFNDSYEILQLFGQRNQDNFFGSLAHLLSTRQNNLGGIAWINALCQSYNSTEHFGRFAFSNIYPSNISTYPIYSWPVNVVAHEMGHNFGSYHTHACRWPTRPGVTNGAIDSCYNAEGGFCFSNPRPARGTIMSYCHLWTVAQGGGVDFTKGFGPLPGDTIRKWYSASGCFNQILNSSERPSVFALTQNFPNPFNPVTNFKFSLPVSSIVTLKVYDISGREITTLLSNQIFNEGTFSYQFSAAEFNLSSGVYFYRLDAVKIGDNSVNHREIRKMILLK